MALAARILLGGVLVLPATVFASDYRLIDAIKDQNRRIALELIGKKADVNAALPDGSTPLAWAAYEGDAQVVTALLRAGAKVNAVDEYGETPLTLACANGDDTIVDSLIEFGADSNSARWNGETALMIAAGSGNPKVVKALLAHGAKIEAAESRKGQNALMWAASHGHPEVVDALLKAGANPNTASKGSFSPLVFASGTGDAKSAALLLAAKADVNHTVPPGVTPLVIAVTGGKAKVADVLIANGADVSVKDRTGNTALHIAAQSGDAGLAAKLIARGADVNAKTNKTQAAGGRGGGGGGFFRGPSGEQTPLMLAARGKHVDVMKALIAAGADPKLRAQDGSTLLMAASNSGNLKAVQYAWELDPDAVKAVTDTKSAVMHAAVTGSLQVSTQPEICEVVQFLHDKGAEVDPVDANGRTPIMIADVLPIDKAVELMTKLIKASGAEPHTRTKR